MMIRFPRQPVRAILVVCVGDGQWSAFYSGDEWQGRWRTEFGAYHLVIEEAVRQLKLCGLPCVVQPANDGDRRVG